MSRLRQAVADLTDLSVAPFALCWPSPRVGADRHHRQSRRHRPDAQGGALPGVRSLPCTRRLEQRRDGHRRAGPFRHPERPWAYIVHAELAGFRQQTLTGLERPLGERELVDVRLQVAAVTETVEVVATPSLIDSSVAGTGANVSNAVKETLPTITRSIADMRASARCSTRRAAAPATARRRCGGHELPLQRPPDSTARPTTTCSDWQDRPVLRRRGGNAADQPRRHPGNPAGRLALRRASGRLRWRRYQRHHQERLERGAHGVLLRPQPELGRRRRRRSADLRVQGQAVRRQRRRSDRPEQGVLLRHRGLRAQASADGLLGQFGRPAVRQRS